MTLKTFQKLLQKINPRLRLRYRGNTDIGGVFVGKSGKSGFIVRLTAGDITLYGARGDVVDEWGDVINVITKRSRLSVVNRLRKSGWINNHKQISMLCHGIKYLDSEVKGLMRRPQDA